MIINIITYIYYYNNNIKNNLSFLGCRPSGWSQRHCSKSTEEIVEGIRELCMKVHSSSPSAKVIVSEVLPRSQNKFPGGHLSKKFLTDWNRDATSVNFGIIGLAAETPWLEVLTHEEFHTAYGVASCLLSRDGLHLSFDGTHQVAENIRKAATSKDSELGHSWTVNSGSVDSRTYSDVVRELVGVGRVEKTKKMDSD